MNEITSNLDTINSVVSAILEKLHEHTIIFLNGDLASGKTTLTQAIIKTLNSDENSVTSPTFSISQTYPNGIYHYDLYNKTLEEFISLGLFEQLETPKLHIIEWATPKLKELVKEYGFYSINVTITPFENLRIYRIENA